MRTNSANSSCGGHDQAELDRRERYCGKQCAEAEADMRRPFPQVTEGRFGENSAHDDQK
jgi:hypothetical protein